MNSEISPAVGDAAHRALQMLSLGASQEEILRMLVQTAEAANGHGSVSSILLLDDDGLLRNAASPGLPQDYLDAIDGLRPDPKVGTCAAAAATGSVVLTTDFRADEKWAELRHLPLALGYEAAWSQPIKTVDGCVLGTFGTYFPRQREPSPTERLNVESLAFTAACVIGACRGQRPPASAT